MMRLTYPQNTTSVGMCQKMRRESAMKFGEREVKDNRSSLNLVKVVQRIARVL